MTSSATLRAVAAAAAGIAVATVDNFAFRGEVSPVVVVALLLVATAAAGAIWGWPGWVAAAITGASVPLAHVVKHALGLPDTLQPNTWASIGTLAVFTLAVSAAGLCGGVLLRMAGTEPRT
ncbi:MAG TPA: hypothetical protein VMW48_19140 [Vicinamibacterales bacterium]|nr:hypothetical protein [Vicinamibacterales bacterium]